MFFQLSSLFILVFLHFFVYLFPRVFHQSILQVVAEKPVVVVFACSCRKLLTIIGDISNTTIESSAAAVMVNLVVITIQGFGKFKH